MPLQDVIQQLHEISRLAKSSDAATIGEAIRKTRSLIGDESSLRQLNQELSTWESKLQVILKEPEGRQGMAKHAAFWAEKLRKL